MWESLKATERRGGGAGGLGRLVFLYLLFKDAFLEVIEFQV